jgi:hypothetical protein
MMTVTAKHLSLSLSLSPSRSLSPSLSLSLVLNLSNYNEVGSPEAAHCTWVLLEEKKA